MKLTTCLLLLFFFKITNAQPGSFTSSNLPIVVIKTLGKEIVDEPKINATMGIIYNGVGVRNLLTDPNNNYNGNIGIEYRGKSSQMFPMKSYSVELRDAANASQEKSLLGIAKESDWVLYAPYTDKTLMRNVLAYTLSSKLGRWAPQCRYVELVVNNEYRGVYVLMEKIKRGANRVNITKLATTDITGDAVTGGYIISIDKDPAAFTSRYPPPNAPGSQIRFSNVYPKDDKVTPQQNDYIKRYTDSFETALYGNSYQDPQIGVRKYANLSSFVDYFLINELSHNVDGYRLSTYMFKDRSSLGGKLNAGPVWDYDLAFRNANYCNGSNTDTWAYQFNNICPTDFWQVPFWWEKLMTDTAFESAVKCRYTSLRKDIFSTPSINSMIDSIQSLLSEAQVRHFAKWPILGQYIWPNPQPIPTSYEGEITALKNWIRERNIWMEFNMPNVGGCAIINENAGLTIQVAPNPVAINGAVNIISTTQQRIDYIICNSIGQTLLIGTLLANRGVNRVNNIPFKNWPDGMYFIKAFTSGGEKTTAKMMLLR
jgi:CotH kinase protein